METDAGPSKEKKTRGRCWNGRGTRTGGNDWGGWLRAAGECTGEGGFVEACARRRCRGRLRRIKEAAKLLIGAKQVVRMESMQRRAWEGKECGVVEE
jgi:hypothetical protein